jgi:hypothetical protein
MNAVLRSELLKQRTTRTILQLPLWMVGLVALVVLLHVFSLDAATLSSRDGQLKVLGWGTSVGALFAALLGALSITCEIRYGTIRPTFLATPRRARVIIAKVAASALAGLAIGLLAEALTAGLESAGLATRGIHIAVGVGAIVRNQVGAVVGLCVWLLLIETTLIGNVPGAGKFVPGAGAGALAGAIQTQSASKLLTPALGALLLAAYAGVATALGLITTERRDIN